MDLSGLDALYKNPINLNSRAANFDAKYDLHRGIASILLVSTLLTIGELYFYKSTVDTQIRKSIDGLTGSASVIDSLMNPDHESDNSKLKERASRRIDEISYIKNLEICEEFTTFTFFGDI